MTYNVFSGTLNPTHFTSLPKLSKFLYDVDRTSALLTRLSAFSYCRPLWNASPKKEDVSPISPMAIMYFLLDLSGLQLFWMFRKIDTFCFLMYTVFHKKNVAVNLCQ